MKISAIIISYNEKDYIKGAIDSCLAQRNEEIGLEIIIGDDGSTDGSIDLIKYYCTKYPNIVRYFVMDRKNHVKIIPSIRVSNIIKKAISLANGEYVTCLAGDDYYCDRCFYSNGIDFLDNNNQYMAYANGFKKSWDGEKEIIVNCDSISTLPNALFWSNCYLHISCFIFRKKVIDDGYLLPNFCDDTGLLYSILCAGDWHYKNNTSLVYRQRINSITSNADSLELNILEICLFEDCLDAQILKASSKARFAKSYYRCYKAKNVLSDQKYKHYIELSMRNRYPLLYELINFEKLSLIGKGRVISNIAICFLFNVVFKILRSAFLCYKREKVEKYV